MEKVLLFANPRSSPCRWDAYRNLMRFIKRCVNEKKQILRNLNKTYIINLFKLIRSFLGLEFYKLNYQY